VTKAVELSFFAGDLVDLGVIIGFGDLFGSDSKLGIIRRRLVDRRDDKVFVFALRFGGRSFGFFSWLLLALWALHFAGGDELRIARLALGLAFGLALNLAGVVGADFCNAVLVVGVRLVDVEMARKLVNSDGCLWAVVNIAMVGLPGCLLPALRASGRVGRGHFLPIHVIHV